MISTFLAELGLAIEAVGIAGVEPDVAVVVAAARSTAANEVLTSVLADRRAPEVLRSRAFGRLALELGHRFETGAASAHVLEVTAPAPAMARPVAC